MISALGAFTLFNLLVSTEHVYWHIIFVTVVFAFAFVKHKIDMTLTAATSSFYLRSVLFAAMVLCVFGGDIVFIAYSVVGSIGIWISTPLLLVAVCMIIFFQLRQTSTENAKSSPFIGVVCGLAAVAGGLLAKWVPGEVFEVCLAMFLNLVLGMLASVHIGRMVRKLVQSN